MHNCQEPSKEILKADSNFLGNILYNIYLDIFVNLACGNHSDVPELCSAFHLKQGGSLHTHTHTA